MFRRARCTQRGWRPDTRTRHCPLPCISGRAPTHSPGSSIHALDPAIALSGFPADAYRPIPGAGAYPAEADHPTISADLVLEPGMTFALEPNYVFGRHLAYLGGTVIVGAETALELNPYTAQILRAAGTPAPVRHRRSTGSVRAHR